LCSLVTGKGDSRQLAEKLLVRLKETKKSAERLVKVQGFTFHIRSKLTVPPPLLVCLSPFYVKWQK
jgi:hypothetical protein